MVARFTHHDFAGHHQNFFARNREIFARFNRRQCWAQSACSNDRHQHHVGVGEASELAQSDFAGKNPRLVVEIALQDVHLRFIDQADCFWPHFVRRRHQLLRVAVRSQSDNLHPLRNVMRHFQRAVADRSGRAQHHDPFTFHFSTELTKSPHKETGSDLGSRNFFLNSKRSAPTYTSTPSLHPVAESELTSWTWRAFASDWLAFNSPNT